MSIALRCSIANGREHGRRKDFFQGWAKSGEISFYPLFLLKTEQKNVKFQNPGRLWLPSSSLPTPMTGSRVAQDFHKKISQ